METVTENADKLHNEVNAVAQNRVVGFSVQVHALIIAKTTK